MNQKFNTKLNLSFVLPQRHSQTRLFVIQTPLTKRQPSSQTHAESLKSTKGCLKQQPLSHQPIVIATKQPN